MVLRWLGRAGFVLLTLAVLIVALLTGFRISAALREAYTADQIAPAGGRFITTSGGRVFVQDNGPVDGTPVLLLHGTAAWSEFWRGTIDYLVTRNYRVIALDLPPFGYSDRAPTGSYTREEQARRIIGVLDGLELRKALFVGHSFGAGATVEAVLRHPDRAMGLVLVAAALGLPQDGEQPADPPPWLMKLLDLPIVPELLVSATGTNPMLTRYLLGTMLARKEAATLELADVLRQPMNRSGTTAEFVRWTKAFLTPDHAAISGNPDAFRQLAVKTRIIWGDRDTVTPLAQGERLARLIPGSTLSVVEDAGHIPQIEIPEVFRPLLLRQMSELR